MVSTPYHNGFGVLLFFDKSDQSLSLRLSLFNNMDVLRIFDSISIRRTSISHMKKLHFMLGLLAFMLVAVSTQAQNDRFVKEADNAYHNEAYSTAIDLYKKAYAKESNVDEKARLIYMIAECYRQVLDLEQEIVWYTKALKSGYDKPSAYKYMADAYRELGNFQDAIENYNRYLDKVKGDPEVTQDIAACKQAQDWMKHPSRYEVADEVSLNSDAYDFSPTWADNKYNEIYFTSSRQAAVGTDIDERTGEDFQDIFQASRDNNGKWSVPVLLTGGEKINSPQNEGSAVLNGDKSVMYFTRCTSTKDVNEGCDIYRVIKVGDKWGDPQKLPLKPKPTKKGEVYSVGHPAITPDESLLIFAGDIPGGYGGKDLWMVHYDKNNNTWTKPENLGKEINTKGNEMFPYLRKNGSLYFASDGHVGMGGLDIFSADSIGPDKWGNVTNMKVPINSVSNDYGIIFEGDKNSGYFTSDRQGGKGKDDIWSFHMPALVFALKGVVYDKDSKVPVPGAEIKVVGSDGSSYQQQTDDNGSFDFEQNGDARYIKPDVTYSIEVTKPQYLVAKDQISTVGLKESTTFAKEYMITYTAPNKAISFPEVRYALDKAELQVNDQVNSKDSLDYLYKTLKDNPTIVIELMANTDQRGSNSYNLKLSQRRAESCVKYLVSKGIDPARLVAKGYGETNPKITQAQIDKMKTQEEKEAAYQKNRRTEFRVLSFDYVPKDKVDSTGTGGSDSGSGGN